MCDWIQIVLSAVSLVAAILIPKKIQWEQTYSSLMSDYRGYDFAAAVQGITEFFSINCGNDVTKIKKQYENVFQMYQKKYQKGEPVSNDQNLHFQRRLLTEFYWQLNQCAESIFIRKKRIMRDFTRNEANMIKVLYYMNLAVDESPVLFKDISTNDIMPKPEKRKGINKSLLKIYFLLKDTSKHLQ